MDKLSQAIDFIRGHGWDVYSSDRDTRKFKGIKHGLPARSINIHLDGNSFYIEVGGVEIFRNPLGWPGFFEYLGSVLANNCSCDDFWCMVRFVEGHGWSVNELSPKWYNNKIFQFWAVRGYATGGDPAYNEDVINILINEDGFLRVGGIRTILDIPLACPDSIDKFVEVLNRKPGSFR
jgi:hypothetical protein